MMRWHFAHTALLNTANFSRVHETQFLEFTNSNHTACDASHKYTVAVESTDNLRPMHTEVSRLSLNYKRTIFKSENNKINQ